MLPNFFKCLLNCVCYVSCYTSSSLFISFGSLAAVIITQWGQWSPNYKIWNHSSSMHSGRYWHQSFWNCGLFSSPAEVWGFLEYQLHIKGTVLCFWSSLRCIKIWVLLALEIDAGCTSLSGHSGRKIEVLILVWCYKASVDREQDLWMYWRSKAALSNGVRSL